MLEFAGLVHPVVKTCVHGKADSVESIDHPEIDKDEQFPAAESNINPVGAIGCRLPAYLRHDSRMIKGPRQVRKTVPIPQGISGSTRGRGQVARPLPSPQRMC